MPKTLPKTKPKNAKNPPKAKVLEEYVPEKDPWKQLRSRPGVKILSTARREP